MKKYIQLAGLLWAGVPSLLFAQQGNVGINTAAPTQKLHVKGGFRFETSDTANPAAMGKTLVGDANGKASWKTVKLTAKNYHPSYGTISTALINYYDSSYTNQDGNTQEFRRKLSGTIYTGTSITLPPGKWLVFLSLVGRVEYSTTRNNPTWTTLPADKAIWIRSSFGDNTTGSNKNTEMSSSGLSADIYGPNLISNSVVGPSSAVTVSGELFINNKSTADKSYYLKVSCQVDGMNNDNGQIRLVDFGLAPDVANNKNLSNKIIAYPID